MNFVEGILVALDALRGNKMRTLLTLLGNIVGVMSVIAVVSVIDGMDSYIRTEVADEGTGIFRVQRLSELEMLTDFEKFQKALHNPEITLSDLDYLRQHVPLAEFMDANRSTDGEVRYRRFHIKGVRIQGRSEYYPLMGKWTLKDGRHFSGQEVIHSQQVAVIGYDVADRMFAGEDPIGKELRIAGVNHRIIGVLEQAAGVLGGNPNLTVIVPITSFEKIFGTHQSIVVSIKSASLDQVNECVEQARSAMRNLHHLGPKREDNFAIVTSDNLLRLWERISKGIFAALIGIVSISLLVGGIVIMNIMLVSVTERTREIGIRKAVGARRLNILWQFLVEAISLSSFGGLLGIALGFLIAASVAYFSPLPYAIKAWSIVAGVLVTLAVGVFFGLYPAMQAARLDPIEALRYE